MAEKIGHSEAARESQTSGNIGDNCERVPYFGKDYAGKQSQMLFILAFFPSSTLHYQAFFLWVFNFLNWILPCQISNRTTLFCIRLSLVLQPWVLTNWPWTWSDCFGTCHQHDFPISPWKTRFPRETWLKDQKRPGTVAERERMLREENNCCREIHRMGNSLCDGVSCTSTYLGLLLTDLLIDEQVSAVAVVCLFTRKRIFRRLSAWDEILSHEFSKAITDQSGTFWYVWET